MALTTAEANTITNRFLAIESVINDMQTAFNKLPTKTQLIGLTNIRQAEIVALQEEVATLRSMVEALTV